MHKVIPFRFQKEQTCSGVYLTITPSVPGDISRRDHRLDQGGTLEPPGAGPSDPSLVAGRKRAITHWISLHLPTLSGTGTVFMHDDDDDKFPIILLTTEPRLHILAHQKWEEWEGNSQQ